MATSLFQVATNSNDYFLGTSNSDTVMRSALVNQKMHIGNSSNVVAALVISSNLVGIAQSNPTKTLDVNGDINFTGALFKSGTPYVGSQWSNNSSNIFALNSNVGINTTTPSTQLDVNGTFIASSNIYVRTSGTSNLPSFSWSADSNTGMFRLAEDTIGFTTSNIVRLTVGSNIGVNTQTPTKTLDVAGDINFTGALFKSGTPYIGSQWSNNSSNIFALSSNVGINTSTPSKTLDVAGDINFTGLLYKSGTPYVGSQWSNNSSNIFVLNSNIGIGTTTPSKRLDVTGDINFTGDLYKAGVLYTGSVDTTNFVATNITASNITCSNINIQGATLSLQVLATNIGTVSTSNIQVSQLSSLNNLTTSNIKANDTFDTSNVPSYSWIGDSNTGMYHQTTGTVGFTAAGLHRLSISSNIMFTGRVCINSNVTAYPLYVGGSNTDDVSILAERDICAFSDARYKINLETITNALSNIDQITGYTYNWIDGGKRFAGVLAQDVQKVLPEVVSEDPTSGKLSVSYGNMISLAIEAIKDIKKNLVTLHERVTILEQKSL